MQIRWLGNSAVEINGDRKLLIDPNYQIEPKIEPDIILITHEHNDHINPRQIKQYSAAAVYAPLSVFEDYDIEGEIVKSGQQIEDLLDVVNIDCYRARSSVGYVYNGIYHTGDASSFPVVNKNIKLLFTACFPNLYSEYIASCKKIEPDLVIPYHYDINDKRGKKAAQGLAEKLNKEGIRSQALKAGSEIII